jgi:hypothetical protein
MMPQALEVSVFAKFGITNYIVCRSPTPCPNISYNVVHMFDTLKMLQELVETGLGRSTTSSVLVFVHSKEEAKGFADDLYGTACHSEMSVREVNTVLDDMRSGTVRVVVSTTLLGVALDIPSVSDVIHVGYPWDFISFTQESGRAGRVRTSMAWSTILLSATHSTPTYPHPDRFGVQLMTEWVDQKVTCRRIGLMTFNDGVAETCATLNGGISHLCDVCRIQSLSPPILEPCM